MDLNKFKRIKARVIRQLQSEKDRSAGMVDQLTEELRREFKVSSVSKARKLRDKLKDKIQALDEKYETTLAKFEEDHPDALQRPGREET